MLLLIAFTIAIAVLIILIYKSIYPPPPNICGTRGGPSVTSPRIKLRDGRYLAYREIGVPKEEAKYKIILNHGFDETKHVVLPISQDLIKDLKIYILQFDRAGYGESDPYPSRSVKSEAYDIEELADQLQIGSKFYVMGLSVAAYAVYGCLKYIPHRLAGAALVVPVVNYWWRAVPKDLLNEALRLYNVQDQWAYRVAHYVPWLFYWWMKQPWLTSSCMLKGNLYMLSSQDLNILKIRHEIPLHLKEKVRQQGEHECIHRDVLVAYAKWEFDPTELDNPFPNNEGSIHLWQGLDDRISPLPINQYILQKLPWIKPHYVPNGGHLIIHENEHCEAIVRALLLG